MSNTKPTVGRIVNYMSRGSLDGKFPPVKRAAIITDVRPITPSETSFEVRVTVFNPEGLFFSDWLQEGEQGGNWSWPVREN